MNKRLVKEVNKLITEQNRKDLEELDYFIVYDESNINIVKAIIKGPYDSVYKHKFVRLDIQIPDNYPHSPPQVKFINYDRVRIHPNMYENGKCCSTILNTWGNDPLEKWTSSMGIETILLTFHSFLDNNPYTYEPGGKDDPNYTVYVKYQSWTTCLLKYIKYCDTDFEPFINTYLLNNIDEIFYDLNKLNIDYPRGLYNTRCFEIGDYIIDYSLIETELKHLFNYIDFDNYIDSLEQLNICDTGEYKCNICFDTKDSLDVISLECNHTFHKECIVEHFKNNNKICSICRGNTDFIFEQQQPQVEEYMINPDTGRRIKVGGKTWNILKINNKI
jgi:ubiquitin-protein ligase